jgi:hypothetical protein
MLGKQKTMANRLFAEIIIGIIPSLVCQLIFTIDTDQSKCSHEDEDEKGEFLKIFEKYWTTPEN